MATAQLIDQAKQEAFVNKVLGDTSATMTTILASIGDRLGLFKDLATKGPGTSAEVARRTGTNERYVHEWLGGMVAADMLNTIRPPVVLRYRRNTQPRSLPRAVRFSSVASTKCSRAVGGRRPGD